MTDVFNVEEAPKFSDPLLEFLTQAEQEEKPSARNRSSSSASSSKPSASPPAITTTKNVSAQPTDFKMMEEATDGHDFLSLIEQHTKKKPTSRSNYNDDLEKELNEPFMEPPRPTLPQMVEEFETVWDKENETDINLDALNLKAQRGGLQNTRLRGLCWKIFLGTCTGKNPSEWLGELQAYRDDYDRLNQQYLIDPHKNETELDLQLNNPLSLASDSPWQQYFQDAELKKQIRLDVIRVYPEREFFKNERIREMMLRLLFIYARENPMLMYKQGMHELLAPILYILDREKISADDLPQTEPTTEEEHKTRKVEKYLAETNDSRYVEHDAYVMFRKVMDISGKWFMSGSHRPPPQPTKILPDAPFSRPEEPLDISSSSPIVQKCKRIQQELLKRADPELHAYLTSMQMEPQLYALRWVRLLLGREFHLEDVLILWDAIFSYGKDFVLVDYVIVAMLIYIRTQLIDKEQQECLHRLFNYPPVEDVLCLIEHALVLINPALMTPTAVSKEKKEAPAEPQETVEHPAETIQVSPSPTTATTTTSAQPPTSKGKKDPKKKKKSFMSAINSIISEPPKEPKKPSPLEQQIALQQHQIHQLEQRQLHMSNRLERIVYTLQRELAANNTEESEEAREERRDSMLLALAELKVIKDTLAGLLPETGEGEGEATGNGDPLGVGHM